MAVTGELFEVSIPALRTGSGHLGADSGNVQSAADTGADGAANAQAASGEGPLGAALGGLASGLRDKSKVLAFVVAAAGLRLGTNADTYVEKDASAAAELAGTFAGY